FIGTLPGRKPGALALRARTLRRFSTSACTSASGTVIVIRRSSLSRVSTAVAMLIVQKIKNSMVRGGGLEPPHHCWRQDLNLVRLPISPSSPDVLGADKKQRATAK